MNKPRVDLDTMFHNPVSDRVYWDDDTYDALATKIVEYQRTKPFDPFSKLLDRAQEELLPKDDRRKIAGLTMVPKLREKVLAKTKEVYRKAADFDDLEDQIEKQPSKDEILDEICDDELLVRFGERLFGLYSPGEILERFGAHAVLDLIETPELVGYCVTRYMSQQSKQQPIVVNVQNSTQGQPTGQANGKSHPQVQDRLPSMVIVGPTGRFADLLRKRMKGQVDLMFIDGRSTQLTIPTSAEKAIAWTNHCNRPGLDRLKHYGKVEYFTGGVGTWKRGFVR